MISFHRDTINIGRADLYNESFEPAILNDVQRISVGISRFPWSPIQWRFGQRHRGNFIRAAWCVLDFDDGEMTLEQAMKSFSDCIHIIGTTRSHRLVKGSKPACDRFRVLVKFDDIVEDLAAYEATMAYYIRKYDTDRKCKDGARFFWPCTSIVQVSAEGWTFEVFDPPPERPPPDLSLMRAHKRIPRWAEGFLKLGLPDGHRNDLCNKLGFFLSQCGFNADEISTLILKSPTNWNGLSRFEVERQVRNGVRAGLRKIVDGEETPAADAKEDAQVRGGGGAMRAPEGES